MIIRRAAPSDISSIREQHQRLFEENIIHGFVPESEERIGESIGSYFLVAELGGEIVGFVSGRISVSAGSALIPQGESCLEIENLYVAARFRRQGIGGALVGEVLAAARQNGVAYALLYTATKDIRQVLKFYERYGFQSWYVQMFQKL